MRVALIGGTGTQHLIDETFLVRTVGTPYGEVELFEKTGDKITLYILLRHSKGHTVAPHLINYRANIAALTKLQVSKAIGIYAVGSITSLLPPGTIGLVSDFIDFTGGSRESSFLSKEVNHISMEEPFSPSLQKSILKEATSLVPPLIEKGLYITTSGPRLETVSEIALFEKWGVDYVGMTLSSEASLIREANIEFAAIAYSINWAAGKGEGKLTFLSEEKRREIVDTIYQVSISALTHP